MKRLFPKRVIAVLLVAATLVGWCPSRAYAEEPTPAVCAESGCTLEAGHEGACVIAQSAECETEGCTLGYGHEGECNNQVPTDCETEGCTLGYGHEGECNNQVPAECETEGCTLGYGHEGECNNQVPTDCETEGCTLGYGHEGECNNQAPTECETEGCTLGYGHEGECNNQVPTDCETKGCTLGYGHEGECNAIDLLENEEEAADPKTVYISLTVDGELQKSRDGTHLAYRELTVTDSDKDGKISLLDVVDTLHREHYPDYSETALGYSVPEDQQGIDEIWGHTKESGALHTCAFTLFNSLTTLKDLTSVTDDTITLQDYEVENNYYVLISAGKTAAVNPSFFLSYGTSDGIFLTDISIAVGEAADITLDYKPDSGLSKKSVGYNIYFTDAEGNENNLQDADGNNIVSSEFPGVAKVPVFFQHPGDYLIFTKPAEQQVEYGAAVLRVHVYEKSSVTISNAFVTLENSDDAASLFTYDETAQEYDIVVSESRTALYGGVTYGLTQPLQTEIRAKFEYTNGTSWTTSSGESGYKIERRLPSKNVQNYKFRLTVSDRYVSGGAFGTYPINLKQIPILSTLKTNLFLTESFNPDKDSYTAVLPDTYEAITFTPTLKVTNSKRTIDINGVKATNKKETSIPISDISFDEEGKAEISVCIKDSRTDSFTDHTYLITIYRAPANDIPAFLGTMAAADYIVGDQAAPLNALASASGQVTYQWYRNTEESADGATLLDGQTTSTFTPPTDEAGTFYYYCQATNSATEDTVNSSFVRIAVYSDPTPTIRWTMSIPAFDQDRLEYLQQKHPNGKLPDSALVGGQYSGYYYHAKQDGVVPLTAQAESAAGEAGNLTYYWSYSNAVGGGGRLNFYSGGASYTPDVSTSNGARIYSVQAAYEFSGKTYWSEEVYVYVFTDFSLGTAPDDLSWPGEGTQASPWMLSSQQDLENLRFYVNEGYTFENKFLQFANDISLDLNWQGLGRDDGDISADKGKLLRVFSGTLDGGGHTLTYAKGARYPLFNYARETTVQNLNILAPYIANYGLVANYVVDYGEDGDYNVGSGGSYAPGCPDTIEIRNVTILSGSIIQQSGFIGGGASGGNTVTILNCAAQSGVKIGCNEDGSSAGLSAIGSFAGRMSGSVTNCTSSADVYGSNLVAGIVAGKSQSMGNFTVRNNVFLGSVHASGTMAGGIVGSGYLADSAPNSPCVSIENCYVVGSISGANYVGGILGAEPGVVQAWPNGKGNIKNNFFYGTLSSSGSYVGGIAGYVHSLNRYNCIENNYFLDTCGTAKGIGGVKVVDTSSAAQHPAWVDGVYYINTAGATQDYLRQVVYELYGNNTWEQVKNPDSNRTDDPLGADADKLTKAMTAQQFADGTVTLLLNQHPESSKNWGQGDSYPTHNGAKVAVHLELSGNYSTTVEQGQNLDLTGIVITATWSDGSTSEIPLKDIQIRGFDKNTIGEQIITLAYGAATQELTVTVRPKSTKITVTVSLLGDSAHNSDTDGVVHGLAMGNLETWIKPTACEADASETVWQLLQRVFTANGFSCDNPSGNYIRAINGLAEFTNGKNSGWMYTLNGTHPSLGVNQQYMKDGDVIVFHYTDDYTKEEGSWSNGDGSTADKVDELISRIGEVTLTSECKQKIDAARRAYDSLSDSEKKKVTQLPVLTAAEKKYNELKTADDLTKAKNVDNLIGKIGTVTTGSGEAINRALGAYRDLTPEQQQLVTKFGELQTALRTWNKLKSDEVISLIDKIVTPVTAQSKASIDAARKAYDALTADQKAMVTNLKKLTNAETAYAKLTATPSDENKAQAVIDQIKKLGDITLDSEKDILAARKAYDALTDLQKKLVENYDVLTAAEAKLAMLKTLGKVSDSYINTGDYMEKLGTPSVGAVGGEWMVIGLARSGRTVPGADTYYQGAVQYIQQAIDKQTGRLHKAKSTDNSRMILALTALGKDVTNVGGYNLLQGLSDLDYVKYQGNNGPIWALLALDSGNYPAPTGGTTTRQALIDEILRVQTSDGGWAISGDKADSDMTGMALTALAPYYKKDLKVQEAIDKAVARLSEMQDADGGFSTTYGDGKYIATSESTAQVLTALSALGINADTDARFIKNGSSVVDALLRYYVSGGGFKHVMDGAIDGMGTEQAYYALTAYYRFLTGKTNLYDMTDVINRGGDPAEAVEPTVPATTEPSQPEPAKSGFPWWIIVICIVAAYGLGVVTVTIIIPKFKKKG